MTGRDDVIRMAREAGFGPAVAWPESYPPFERFAALVAAAERDAILQLWETDLGSCHDPMGQKALEDMEAAIRARDKP